MPAPKDPTRYEEYCKKLSERMRGNTYSLGYIHSEETRRKESLARKGKSRPPFSEEWKEKMKPIVASKNEELKVNYKNNLSK